MPKELGKLVKLQVFNARNNELRGGLSAGLSASDFVLIWSLFFAGQLPKELGKLVNLEKFDVYGNKIEGQLSIHATSTDQPALDTCVPFLRRPVAVAKQKNLENCPQGEASGLQHLLLRCAYV